ncbi:MAG: hypothetical protein JST84_26740 [Acidobacteria bacterium]|nr:hypothetical protein [Acidobacteriota bacterium]
MSVGFFAATTVVREDFGIAVLAGVATGFFLETTLGARDFFAGAKGLAGDFLDAGLAASFWRGEVLADLLLSDLGDRFAVAAGEARRDFVRLEMGSLIA